MSFDVNVLSSKPIIKPASSMQNDGGGGNLGYMFQGRRQDEGNQKNIFEKDGGFDTFGSEEKVAFTIDDCQYSFMDIFADVIEFFNKIWLKVKDVLKSLKNIIKIK